MALRNTITGVPSLVRIGTLLAMSALSIFASASALAAPNGKAVREALIADYPLTRVGNSGLQIDYNRITQPGAVLAVRVPGIYADEANTEHTVVGTNITNGQVSQASGFFAAAASSNHSRTLAPSEKVYVTNIFVKHDAVLLELLTVDVTTLAEGRGTRYIAELNFKLPGIDSMSADDIKKVIDPIVADPTTASAVQSKTIKLGMSQGEVKQSLGNPDKIVDLGPKQVYVYKDMKVVFLNSQVSDVQ